MRGFRSALAAAAALTLLNAVKPAVVDDTAYLLRARHIAAHPLDPYGGELFWSDVPQPAMEVLAPPVLPYWLAAGMALCGEHLLVLKLWLFPFALTFCVSARVLLRRFARGTEGAGVWMLALGPAVLPLFDFMLDVPAVALGLAAVALFVRGCDRGSWAAVVAAGVLAGLAAQTKYTMLTIPVVCAWYGLLRRRYLFALLSVAAAAAVFGGWEAFLAARYGESHFWHHAGAQADRGGVEGWLAAKRLLFGPLLGHLGWLGLGSALYVLRPLGVARVVVVATAVLASCGLLAVCAVPHSQSILLRNAATGSPRLDLPALVFYPLGLLVLASAFAAVVMLGFPWRCRPSVRRRDQAAWFLAGWLLIELAAYFALTPFPAARRVIALAVVIGFVACRLVSRVRRARPGRAPGRWVPAYAVGLGLALWALDAWDALPERELAYKASEVIGERGGGRVWFQGHWGWQYYCDRLGMRLVVPRASELRPGDWLVVPVLPDADGFYRPYHGEARFRVEPDAVVLVAELVWLDPLAAQTIPNLYGGQVPVVGRDHPRLRVAVYRVTREWVPAPD